MLGQQAEAALRRVETEESDECGSQVPPARKISEHEKPPRITVTSAVEELEGARDALPSSSTRHRPGTWLCRSGR